MSAPFTSSTTQLERNKSSAKNHTFSLVILTTLFFIWGFIVSMNDVLIPKLMTVFTLLHWQAMLVQTSFFGAYFIISLAYFVLSVTREDPIMKIGYKNGIIAGLFVCALGASLFYPAAAYKSYGFFLGALFVLASGTAILQIASNPYVTILGSPETASARLNLTQAFNSLGTTIAPILGGYLIFGTITEAVEGTNADSVKLPYIALAAALILIAIMIKTTKLPRIVKDHVHINHAGSLKHRHLILGVICIFAYVGGEVTIGSNFMSFLKLPAIGGFEAETAKTYLAFFWGGAMIGRFLGAIALGNFERNSYKYGLMFLISIAVFITVYTLYNFQLAAVMCCLVLFNAAIFRLANFKSQTTLSYFAAAIILLLLMVAFTNGQIALWSIIAIGFFNSIMFPTIFALAVKGLGSYTSQGASLLIMACVGGAIVPPLQGYFADISNNLQLSFTLPILCYVYVLFYGMKGYKTDIIL
ncbi:sugar MFS transporter [Pedobacter sp. AK017]|uniref:sugar MFS transporter n=1 Tax=Pedobacter sp. AK017 TaxID=2723073 RepID=UPI00160962C0